MFVYHASDRNALPSAAFYLRAASPLKAGCSSLHQARAKQTTDINFISTGSCWQFRIEISLSIIYRCAQTEYSLFVRKLLRQ